MIWNRLLTCGAVLAGLTLAACTPGGARSSSTMDPTSTSSAGASASSSPTSASASASASASVKTPHDVVTGLKSPWSIAFFAQQALVSERDSGRIVEVGSQGSLREVGVVPGVKHGGEGGLLGLAVWEQSLFAYSTGADGNRIQRFDLFGSPGNLSLGKATTIVDKLPSGSNHNGGRIAFGPDRMLYATVGDAGRPEFAQDKSNFGGKILRMTPDGKPAPGNPFGTLVYTYGHRNPQGIAWGADGAMYASEFGQNAWDELNLIEKGNNYGWPIAEGQAGRRGMVDPIAQWKPADASPSGIAIVGSTTYIANLRGQRLVGISREGGAEPKTYFAGTYGRLRDVVATPTGELWILTNNTDGRATPKPGDDRIIATGVLQS